MSALIPLSEVLSSCCADIDALGYNNGDFIPNLVENPADGASQQDYDFFNGDDGSVNAMSFTNGEFISDGTQYLTMRNLQGTPALNTAQNINSLYTIVSIFTISDTSNIMNQSIWGSTQTLTVSSRANGIGLSGNSNTTPKWELDMYNGSHEDHSFNDAPLITPQDYIVILSIDNVDQLVSVRNWRIWVNSRTNIDRNNRVLISGTAAGKFRIGCSDNNGTATNFMSNGFKFKHFSVFNEYIDDTEAGQIIDALNSRHGTTYA